MENPGDAMLSKNTNTKLHEFGPNFIEIFLKDTVVMILP
jgi:hypothetical protein